MRMVRSVVSVATPLAIALAILPAAAAPRPLPPEPDPALQAEEAASLLPKTIIYATVASLIDLGTGYVIGGGLATGTAIAVANAASGWLLYYVHESIWGTEVPLDPSPAQVTVMKTATFTAANASRLLGLGFLVPQSVIWSGPFLALDALSDTAAYIVTDRIWVLFGPSARMSRRP